MRTRREFRHIWKRAQSESSVISIAELSRLLKSRHADVRLHTLFKIREQLKTNPHTGYFVLAKRLINDGDNDCRWQAIIIVGEYIHTHPDVVWQIIVRYGGSKDNDLRMAIATVLLEHLLEYHFQRFFIRAKRLAFQSSFFADTLSHSGGFIRVAEDRQKFKRLLRQLEE